MQSINPVESFLDLCRSLIGRGGPDESGTPRARRNTPQFSLTGPLSAGKATTYSINGIDFEIHSATSVLGELRFGALTRVTGTYRNHTVRVAGRIMVEPHRRESHRS